LVAALGHPEVGAFLTAPDVTTVEAMHARIDRLLAGPEDRSERWLNYVLLSEGVVIGRIEASIYDETWSEIAYLVGPAYQRRGYAREAVRWLLAQLPPEVWAAIQPANVRSIALVEALGFSRQAVPPTRPLGSYDVGDGVWALL
jgi:RimJ/RimL family protein N-acetyltransferase